MKDSYIIGILGAGNMGEALIKGLLRSQLVRSYEIIASGKRRSRLHALEKSYGVHTTIKNSDVMTSTNTIIIAVKPQNMEELSSQIKPYVTENHLFISIAAGIDIKKLRHCLGPKPKLIRVMPNLPSVVDQGISAIFCGARMPERYRRFAHQVFQAVGKTVDVKDEHLMDVITGLSGTGPAYIFAMMEAMINVGVKMGLSPKMSEELTKQTVFGAAMLGSQDNVKPTKLREQVTSKKGTTWAAMNVFKKKGFWDLIESSINAAVKRSKELREARK
ncbi:MAG: pyrroline-5-carboxylate reductase [Deltaproteobacteria bacterium CG07_land_8_20_14_0_80_38_7]|nr:MAG: pyrroline-5-carboxylate reductase [Deltaproteobacteria bacterium CG07_land_8_20_14_0_80_38_7]